MAERNERRKKRTTELLTTKETKYTKENHTMKKNNVGVGLFIITLILLAYASAASAATQLSAEALGVLRYDTKSYEKTWGAAVDVGVKFNSWVTGHVRAISYETDDWRGGAIDEGAALIEARLFQSANNALSLSAVGGVTRSFAVEDWGLAGGGRLAYALSPNVSIVLESLAVIQEQSDAALLSFAGVRLSF